MEGHWLLTVLAPSWWRPAALSVRVDLSAVSGKRAGRERQTREPEAASKAETLHLPSSVPISRCSFFLDKSHYVGLAGLALDQAGFQLTEIFLSLPGAGLKGVRHHSQLPSGSQ